MSAECSNSSFIIRRSSLSFCSGPSRLVGAVGYQPTSHGSIHFSRDAVARLECSLHPPVNPNCRPGQSCPDDNDLFRGSPYAPGSFEWRKCSVRMRGASPRRQQFVSRSLCVYAYLIPRDIQNVSQWPSAAARDLDPSRRKHSRKKRAHRQLQHLIMPADPQQTCV